MRLYVCWGTFGDIGHPCGKAYKALKGAGHDPEVQKVRGWVVKESDAIADWAKAHRAAAAGQEA